MCSGLWPMETRMPRRVSDSMMSLAADVAAGDGAAVVRQQGGDAAHADAADADQVHRAPRQGIGGPLSRDGSAGHGLRPRA